MATIVSRITTYRDIARIQADEPLFRDEWRYTGPFTRFNRFKGAFPGLGIATVAFTIYCGYEYLFMKDEHHDKGHGTNEHH